MADAAADVQVDVVYAEPGQVWSRTLHLPAGATVWQAVQASGLADERPHVRLAEDMLGVFGRRVGPQQLLRDGDRVEILRPLVLDPMEARRRRAHPDA